MILLRCLATMLLVSAAIPAVAAETAFQAVTTADWAWRLTGTLLTANQKIAVFASRDGKTESVVEGKQIDGWTVLMVRSHSAILSNQGVTRTITVDGFAAEETGTAGVLKEKDAAVRDNLAKQEHENKAALDALGEATKRMELHRQP